MPAMTVGPSSVEDQPQPTRMAGLNQFRKGLFTAQTRVNGVEVLRVIPVRRIRVMNGSQNNRVDTKVSDPSQLLGHAAQIAAVEDIGRGGRFARRNARIGVGPRTTTPAIEEDGVENGALEP